MATTIVEILGLALAVAIVPIPGIAVILLLLSKSGTRNGLSFLAGWLVGLIGLGAVLLAIDIAAFGGAGSMVGGILRLAIGAVLLILGVKKWATRPKGDQEPSMPGWMAAIEHFSAAKSFGMGIALAAANPKNLGLTFAATATIATAGLTNGQEIVTLLAFVILSSLTVAIPVIAFLALGPRAAPVLGRLRAWLVTNADAMMAGVLVVLGAVLLADGISTML